jgi:putative aldouronate transport system substrate-binding protein
MKKAKLLVTLSVITVLLASFLVGCTKKTEENQPSATVAASAAVTTDTAAPAPATDDSLKEHMDISISWWGIGTTFEKPDAILQKIEKDFNITFKPMDIGWDNYKEKSQVWAAAGQLPDIITNSITTDSPATYNEWVNQELIKALPDNLSAYPNIEQITKVDGVQGIYRDGKLYAIPRMVFPVNNMQAVWAVDRAIFVRKDWMDKLNIKDPTNFGEFQDMLKAFVAKDPDGNGKSDTTGIVMNTPGYFESVFVPTFPEFGNKGWLKENGKWIPFYASKKMDQVFVQARSLYTERALDPDFAVEKAGEANQKFYQNKAGAFAYKAGSLGSGGVQAEWEKNNPGQKFFDHVKIIHLWPDANGVIYHQVNSPWWSETMINADTDDKKMERILRIYDWLLSAKGKEMFDYGIEGKDYTKDGDKITVIRPKEANGQFIDLKKEYPTMDTVSQIALWRDGSTLEDSPANRATYGDASVDFIQSEIKWQLTNTKPIPTAFELSSMSTPAKDKLSTINFDDDFVKVILSKEDPVKMWHQILKSYDSKGLQQAITEVTAEMAKQGK